MNEAAILTARRNLTEISKEEIADALERIIAGPEKKVCGVCCTLVILKSWISPRENEN